VGGIRGALVKRCAFLFPGQGSQYSGMGRELADAFPEARAVFDAADRALDSSISKICFEGSDEELALTANTQPAILTVSVAAFRVIEARGIKPVAAAGHSLGEYSAHVAAGTIGFEDAVRTVRQRGQFMQEAVPVGEGAMAAVIGLALADVERVCADAADGEVLSPANLNAPGQIVIAGCAAAVERAIALSREAGAKRAVLLPVSAPFHCSLMTPAADRLKVVLEDQAFADPGVPVYTNVDATPVERGDAARDALVRQVASPVRWEELAGAMFDSGIETFVELGPGRVLAGLMRRIRREARVLGIETPAGLEKALAELGG
jgi:[acyl-carrier-protein] S-malonyltransferase